LCGEAIAFLKNRLPGATISSDAYHSYNALSKEYDHQALCFRTNRREFEDNCSNSLYPIAFLPIPLLTKNSP
jgi:hypothetical protein